MGKSQSREQVIIAQNGADNKADTSLYHEITHSKLDLLTMFIVGIFLITIGIIIFRCCTNRYTDMLRRELRGTRASRRAAEQQPAPLRAPAYSVA